MPRPATDKRERLADAALDLAYRRGFKRASISDIAEHAGVASGSVYYHFKTKDDVGQAAVDRLSSRYLSAIETWRDLPTPEDRLVAFLGLFLDDVYNARVRLPTGLRDRGAGQALVRVGYRCWPGVLRVD